MHAGMGGICGCVFQPSVLSVAPFLGLDGLKLVYILPSALVSSMQYAQEGKLHS